MIKITGYSILKFSLIRLLSIGLLFYSLPAVAELDLTGWYTGAMYSDLKTTSEDSDFGTSEKDSSGHMKAKVGKQVSQYISFEGQLGATTNTDRDHGSFTLGVLLRGSTDLGQYKPYGLLGFTSIYSYAEIDGNDYSSSDSSVSYGVGLEIFGNKDLAISLEYLMMYEDSTDSIDVTTESIGIGFTYYFSTETSQFEKNRSKIKSIRY